MRNGYALLNRKWKKNDIVSVSLPMEVRRVTANAKLKDDAGKIALQRGPLMYCAEAMDNSGDISTVVIPKLTPFTAKFDSSMLLGITILQASVTKLKIVANNVSTTTAPFTAIPYYAWANRGKAEMMMWFPERITGVDIISQ